MIPSFVQILYSVWSLGGWIYSIPAVGIKGEGIFNW